MSAESGEGGTQDELLQAAFEEVIGRKEGTRSPKGGYVQPGIWEPSEDERRPCCDDIRTPNGAWGWSLKKHCESTKHVAQLFGVPEGALQRRARQYFYKRNKERKEGGLRVTMDEAVRSRVAPHVAAQQVERLMAKLKAEVAEMERRYQRGDYQSMKAPGTDELEYWLGQLR